MKKIFFILAVTLFIIVPMVVQSAQQSVQKQSQIMIAPVKIESQQEKEEVVENKHSSLEKMLEQQAVQVQKTYDAMSSLRFVFQQQTSGELTGRPQKGSGWAIFLRKTNAQKMRWEYDEPDKQVIISDGNSLGMYFQKLKQMIITDNESMNSDLTYSFFTGRSSLLKDFEVTAPDDNYSGDGSSTVLKLIPLLTQQHVEHLHIWVDKQNLIRRISVQDHFGTITMLNLSKIEINSLSAMPPTKQNALFSFTPPEGTEIIQQ